MLIDVVDTTQKKSGDDFDLDDDEVEINDDNIESIMKSLEKYK